MRNIAVASGLVSIALLGCAGDGTATGTADSTMPAAAGKSVDAAAGAPAAAAQATAPASPAHRAPTRDGKAHRWELRAFKDNHLEVWMDGERVADARIVREGHRVAVLDDAGTVIERLDLPPNWTPEHGTADAPGTYRAVDGTLLVPPPTMLGCRLEPVPAATLAHLHAAHTAADGSRCTYVASVIPGLPMDAAGAKAHDVIVAVNGSADASPAAVRAVVRAAKPGDAVTLSLVRAGERRDVTVTLAAWDPKHMVNPLGRQDPVPPAMASGNAPTGAAAPAAGTAPAAAPSGQGDDLAAARARIAELERQMQAEDAVRKAIRPQPAPQPK